MDISPKRVRIKLRQNKTLAPIFFTEAVLNGRARLAKYIAERYYQIQSPKLEQYCLSAIKLGYYKLIRWMMRYEPTNYNQLYVAAITYKRIRIKQFLLEYSMFMLATTIGSNSPRLHSGLYLSNIFNSRIVIQHLEDIYPHYITKLLYYLTCRNYTSKIMWVVHNINITTDYARILFEYCLTKPRSSKLLMYAVIKKLSNLDFEIFYSALCECGNMPMIERVTKMRRVANPLNVAMCLYTLKKIDMLDYFLQHYTLQKDDHNALLQLVCKNADILGATLLQKYDYNIIINDGHIIKWIKK